MNPVLLITALGPFTGGAGWFFEIPWLFWAGVVICAITMLLNIASGVMKLPILPVLFMVIAALIQDLWYVGAGIGLLVWTTFEVVGDVIGAKMESAS